MPTSPDAHPPRQTTGHANRQTQGFSLIEILIVIGLIGALLAILIPNVSSARKTASSKISQQFGSTVYLSLNNYLSARPGLTAQTLLSTSGWGPATALPSGSASGALVDCASGYTLSGSTTAPSVVSSGGTAGGLLTSWGPSNDTNVRCSMSAAAGNPYLINIYTWSDVKPGVVYVNGRVR